MNNEYIQIMVSDWRGAIKCPLRMLDVEEIQFMTQHSFEVKNVRFSQQKSSGGWHEWGSKNIQKKNEENRTFGKSNEFFKICFYITV